mmetsp:Transcript_15711/g.36513  ORF Transcript_15711/g.36513 Transcript_15711/m.36513 type:complete len:228 (-) Transcript_15711:334-1017(-)
MRYFFVQDSHTASAAARGSHSPPPRRLECARAQPTPWGSLDRSWCPRRRRSSALASAFASAFAASASASALACASTINCRASCTAIASSISASPYTALAGLVPLGVLGATAPGLALPAAFPAAKPDLAPSLQAGSQGQHLVTAAAASASDTSIKTANDSTTAPTKTCVEKRAQGGVWVWGVVEAQSKTKGHRPQFLFFPFGPFFLSLESLHSVALSQPISANLGPVG